MENLNEILHLEHLELEPSQKEKIRKIIMKEEKCSGIGGCDLELIDQNDLKGVRKSIITLLGGFMRLSESEINEYQTSLGENMLKVVNPDRLESLSMEQI
jgi:hypothetical protein